MKTNGWQLLLLGAVTGCSGSVVIDVPAEPVADTTLQVRSGWESTCAVRGDGRVWCWGGSGLLSGAPVPTPIEGLEDVVSVDVSSYPAALCALHRDGQVTCVGERDGQLRKVAVSGVEEGRELMVNGWFSEEACVRTAAGTVKCWRWQQLLEPGVDELSAAPIIGLSEVTGLVRGAPCALRQGGTLWCWDRLGDDEGAPLAMLGLTDITSAAFTGGGWSLLAVGQDDLIWGWQPSFEDGELTAQQPDAAVVATVPGAVEVVNNIDNACVRTHEGTIHCWGRNHTGQLGLGWAADEVHGQPVEVATLDQPVQQLAVGLNHMAVLDEQGVLRGWGSEAQAGLGDATRSWDDAEPALSDAIDVTVGDGTSCAVSDSDAVWCWGRNSRGQVGDGTVHHAHVPRQVGGLPGMVRVVNGWDFACALSVTGEVWCWGDNQHGQIGTAPSEAWQPPQKIGGLPSMVAVDAGGQHACALAGDGRLWCWGRSDHGQLGAAGGSAPQQVGALEGIVQVELGAQHSCALDGEARVWCWGRNNSGEVLPTSEADALSAPQLVEIVPAAVSIHVGASASCVRDAGGALQCWGQAGTPPQDLGEIVTVGVAQNRVCALNSAQQHHCWDEYGEHTIDQLPFMPAKLASGSRHSCALAEDGVVSCVGDGAHGVLGISGGFVLTPKPLRFIAP